MPEIVGRGHAAVRHRHLPRARHLVAGDHAADRAIADGDEEGLVGDRRETQHAAQRLARIETRRVEGLGCGCETLHIAGHARRLAEQHLEGHVDRGVAKLRIAHHKTPVIGQRADHGERTPLARAEGREAIDGLRRHHQHIALLRLVAPERHRRHAGLIVRDGAQVDESAATAVRDGLRHRIGEPARANVVDEEDRVGLALLPAAIDNLLCAALHLGIAALHGREIEVCGRGTGTDRRGRTAAQTDEHGGTAQHDDLRARRAIMFLHMIAAHIAEAARDHDGLVVAARATRWIARRLDFQGPEVTAD